MMRTRSIIAVVALAVAATGCTHPGTAVAHSRATTAPLTVQTVNGNGCPAGTTTSGATADQVSVDYTAFSVTAGGTGFRKACVLNVLVHPGAGQLMEVTTAHHEGSATLPTGASGTVKTTYYVTGGPNLVSTSSALAAPSWAVDQPVSTGVVSTPCGADVALNIKAELQVSGTGSSAAAQSSVVTFVTNAC